MAAILRVFNGYGPRSSTNLTYWGVAGCANNDSLVRYKDATTAMGLDYLTLGTLLMLVKDSERALVERITGMDIKSPLGLPSPRKPHYIINFLSGYPNNDPKAFTHFCTSVFLVAPLLSFSRRALVEGVTGMDIKSPLGLPSPRKPHYIVNFLPGYAYVANLEAFIDFSAMVSPSLLSSILDGNSVSLPPVFFSSDLRVGTVIVVPIFRHLVPENALREQRRESVSPTAWVDLSYMGNELQDVLHLLHNDSSSSAYSIAMYDTADPGQPIQVLGRETIYSSSSAYSIAMYDTADPGQPIQVLNLQQRQLLFDRPVRLNRPRAAHSDSSASAYSIALYDTTDPQQPIQVLGPDPVKLESGTLFPYVLPGPVVPGPKHIEPFPEDLLGRKYEAHCR
ncbi:unnamed protein product [Closterium sp. Naga37s-1]|nr:unnamed protein product [Closterium sp. Naga37s-1]